MKRIIKKIFVPGLLTLLLFGVAPLQAHAVGWDDWFAKVIANAALFPLFLLQYFGSLLFVLANLLLTFVLNLNYEILKENSLIDIGWTIVRDITNLGFVLVIIVIAISTIIRYEKYAMKALLPKLIGAAIIVNFSLTLSGVFIDFSHSLTQFFFEPLTEGGAGFGIAKTLSAAFHPQSLLGEDTSLEAFVPDDEPNFFSLIVGQAASLIFVNIFLFTSVFALLALALMFFLRYIYLSFLLILSPIVWLFWVVPSFQKYYGQWWDAFMKWILFGPAASFFIYLSLVSIERLGGLGAGDLEVASRSYFADGQFAGMIKQGVSMLILTGFFFGSLIAAQKVGVAGASGAMGLAKKASGKAKSAASKFAKERAKNVRDRARDWKDTLGTQIDEKGNATSMIQRLTSRVAQSPLRNIPIVGGAVRRTQVAQSKRADARVAAATEEQKGLTNLTLDDLSARASAKFIPPKERAAVAMELAKRGKLNDKEVVKTDEDKKRLLAAVQQTNNVKNLLSINPTFAPDLLDLKADIDALALKGVGETQAREQVENDAIEKFARKVTAEKAASLDDAALENAVVMLNVSTGVMARLANEGFDKVQKAEKTLRDLIEKNKGAAKNTMEANIKTLAERNLRSLLHNPQYQDDRTSSNSGEGTPAGGSKPGGGTPGGSAIDEGAATIRET